jgi:hypothetical protein
MATTTNFGWETPDDTDLVKDGAAAIRTALGGVDTSFVDLKGGTTGQILSKASNTDLDYTWVAPTTGDITGVSVTSPITGGGTSGDVTIGISSSAVVPSQTGNSGKYLTTDGTTSSWGTISAGGMTLISSTAMSGSASITLSSIPQTYVRLLLVMSGARMNNSNTEIWVRPNASSTISDQNGVVNGSVAIFVNENIKLGGNNSMSRTVDSDTAINIYNYTSTSTLKPFDFRGGFTVAGGSATVISMGGRINTTSAITSLVITNNASNTFSAGTLNLYGVK